MRKPIAKTLERRKTKADWFKANPQAFQWLCAQAFTPLHELIKKPEFAPIERALKDAGIYKEKTVAVDIASAMRRRALIIACQRHKPTV